MFSLGNGRLILRIGDGIVGVIGGWGWGRDVNFSRCLTVGLHGLLAARAGSPCYASAGASDFKVTEEAGGAAAEGGVVGAVGEGGVEGAEGAFAAGGVFHRRHCGDPRFDDWIGKLLNEVKDILLKMTCEFKDVVIGVEERGDEAA